MLDSTTTVDHLEATVLAAEAEIARLRAIQLDAIRQLDDAGVVNMDGARSMVDWVTAKLDVAPETASALVQASRIVTDDEGEQLGRGECSFDRALAASRLVVAGADQRELDMSTGFDIAGVRRLVARLRRFTRHDEYRVFSEQHLVLQPNLDESQYRIFGSLDGVGGRTVEKALQHRSDQLPDDTTSRAHRYAMSLTSICHDTLNTNHDSDNDSGGGPDVVLFADLDRITATSAETGIEVELGPKAGPAALQEALCGGSIQLVGLHNGRPVVTTDNTKAIPPAVRRFVIWRDGGCAIAGCRSRYRLQVHHIKHRSHGGSHDPDNLTCLCWYHHHVVIHGRGFTIDPTSPPQKRRLVSPHRRAPP
jgi:hypothetical protein